MSDTSHKPPSSPATDEIASERRTLRDYYIIIRERLWIALPLAVLIAVAYGYYKARQTPLFSSTATMQFDKPETVVTTQGVVDSSVRSDMDLNTYLGILNSTRLKSKIVASFTPEEIKILQRPYLLNAPSGSQAPPPSAMLGSPSIVPLRNSYLININVSHMDPEAAALVANRFVEQFMTYLFENVGGKNEDAVIFLKTRADQLRKEAEDADQNLQQYMAKHNLVSLEASTNMISARLASVNETLTKARLNLLTLESLNKQVETFRDQKRNLFEISYISNHGTVTALRTQLATMNQQKAVLSERYFERHPKLVDLENEISATQNQLDRAVSLAIADLNANLAETRTNVANLETEYGKHEKASLDLRELSVDFNSLKSQSEVIRSTYMQILDRLNQTTTTKNLEKVPLHPLDRAIAASAPYQPNMNRIVRTSIALGLGIFFAVAISLSYIDDRIKSAWDVESFVGANLLGIVPDLSQVKDDVKYSLLLKEQEGQSPGAESFLSIYSSVKIQSKLDFPKSILVTSTIPGEGKTLVSCNLAASFARHDKRTLLIDCDLRRPMIHKHFNQTNDRGIIPWFENGANLDTNLTTDAQLGIATISKNLSLLCSGGRSKNPTGIFENPAFGHLLERLKKSYDLVVVDSPPLGAVTDSTLIAENTDELIYVCRFNRASRKHIRLYMKSLRRGKNEILGIVLNGLSPRRIEYYSNYRYYRSYKKYYGVQS